ncbi:MAG: hypothetical protein H7X80_10655 [bacterium]|nr:hypothetical protein [Candidatus Kapabacteria bacterium]
MRAILRAIIFVLIATPTAAQLKLQKDTLEWPTPRNVISVNPAGIAVDYLSISFVRGLSEHHGLGAFGAFTYRPVGDELPRGIGGGLIYQYYPGGQALWRFRYTGQVSYVNAWLTGKRDETALSGIGVGVTIGWQWFPLEGFAVGFSVGEQYIAEFETIEHEALDQIFGWRPLLSFDLGYAW